MVGVGCGYAIGCIGKCVGGLQSVMVARLYEVPAVGGLVRRFLCGARADVIG